jgi:hypothetical protein
MKPVVPVCPWGVAARTRTAYIVPAHDGSTIPRKGSVAAEALLRTVNLMWREDSCARDLAAEEHRMRGVRSFLVI